MSPDLQRSLGTVKRATKTLNLFLTLLQNELNNDDACLATHEPTSLATRK